MKESAFVIALVGAESTGKSTLALELAQHFRAEGIRCEVVIESLRTFCDAVRRTPTAQEQACIARAQSEQIDAASNDHDIVIADTTALMTAVYSDQVFGDTSLYEPALAAHRRSNLTLVTGLDILWLPDGLQRDGPHVRVPVDRKIRSALTSAGIDFHVINGEGPLRTAQALRAIVVARRRHLPPDKSAAQNASTWKHLCGRCGDGDCERQLLRATLARSSE